MNWVNNRKGFFHVSFKEAGVTFRRFGFAVDMLATPEVKEYRHTVSAIDASRRQAAPMIATAGARFSRDPCTSTEPRVDHGAPTPGV
jgi:hypothetical protein